MAGALLSGLGELVRCGWVFDTHTHTHTHTRTHTLSVCLSVCLSVSLSVCLSVCLSVSLSLSLPLSLSLKDRYRDKRRETGQQGRTWKKKVLPHDCTKVNNGPIVTIRCFNTYQQGGPSPMAQDNFKALASGRPETRKEWICGVGEGYLGHKGDTPWERGSLRLWCWI